MRAIKVLLLPSLLSLTTSLSFAQASSQSTGTGSRNNSSAGNPFPEADRLIHFTGKVVLSDTGQPVQGVPVLRVCGNSSEREGYTDAKGKFDIMLGSFSRTEFQDASESGASNDRTFNRQVKPSQLWNCELLVSLPGYQSSTVVLAGRDVMGDPDVGTLVLQKLGAGEGNSISAISLKAPDNARKEFEKGRDSFDNKKLSDAEKHLAQAVADYPDYASAWEMLGRVQVQQQRTNDARKSFQKAIAADDKYVPAYLQLAMLESDSSNWEEVIKLTARASQLDPASYPEAYYLNGIAHFSLSQLNEAEVAARKAVELDKQRRIPRAEFLLGNVLWTKGDERGAAEHMRAYLALDPNCAEAGKIKSYLAKVESSSTVKP